MKKYLLLGIALFFVIGFAHGAESQQQERCVRMYGLLVQLATLDREAGDERNSLIGQLAPTVRGWIDGLDETCVSFKYEAMPLHTKRTFDQNLAETSKFLYHILQVGKRELHRQDITGFKKCSDDLAELLADKINEHKLLCDACNEHDEAFFQKSELSASFE